MRQLFSFLGFLGEPIEGSIGVVFFAENGKISYRYITSWMEKFSDKNVAKCLLEWVSASHRHMSLTTVKVLMTEVDFELEDIKRNKYMF